MRLFGHMIVKLTTAATIVVMPFNHRPTFNHRPNQVYLVKCHYCPRKYHGTLDEIRGTGWLYTSVKSPMKDVWVCSHCTLRTISVEFSFTAA